MKLYPYLAFKGNCEQALNFYKEALDAEITELRKYSDSPMQSKEALKDKIIHGRLRFGDALIMASDMTGPGDNGDKDAVSLSVECDTVEQLEKVFAAMAAGGNITMPLQDQFWGARFGMLTDKFGFHWMFNYEKPQG